MIDYKIIRESDGKETIYVALFPNKYVKCTNYDRNTSIHDIKNCPFNLTGSRQPYTNNTFPFRSRKPDIGAIKYFTVTDDMEEKYGFNFLDRILYRGVNSSIATVLGVADNQLWIWIDNEVGASYYADNCGIPYSKMDYETKGFIKLENTPQSLVDLCQQKIYKVLESNEDITWNLSKFSNTEDMYGITVKKLIHNKLSRKIYEIDNPKRRIEFLLELSIDKQLFLINYQMINLIDYLITWEQYKDLNEVENLINMLDDKHKSNYKYLKQRVDELK